MCIRDRNYDGTNLGEFRKNLATFGAVKVLYDGETKGGVETLEISVNAENYKAILEIFKKALIENGMGYDAKDDRLAGNPNQMNIQSMYSDIDLDANDMETELDVYKRQAEICAGTEGIHCIRAEEVSPVKERIGTAEARYYAGSTGAR